MPCTTLKPEELAKHAEHMAVAIKCASEGSKQGRGGPFGSIILKGDKIVARACNTVLESSDPTCHAEMNAIRLACKELGTHDLSDCALYTTCEPCPMCLGAITWSNCKVVYIGIDRECAAEFGWSDDFYYTELKKSPEDRKISTSIVDGDKRIRTAVVNLFNNFSDYMHLTDADSIISGLMSVEGKPYHQEDLDTDALFLIEAMKMAIEGIRVFKGGKGREPFGTVIVKDGKIVGKGYNQTVSLPDATATAEVVAIADAAKNLGTHDLSGCTLYSTGEPDVMSMGGIYWANIHQVHIGFNLADAAAAGYEHSIKQFNHIKGISESDTICHRRVAFIPSREVFVEYAKRAGTMY